MDIVKRGDNQTKANKKQSTVMFVPWTIRGRLAARLRQEEDRLADLTGFRIKYTEEGGTQLWRQFSTKLDIGLECGREGCVTCDQLDEQKLDCFSRSVVYESVCLLCHPDGKKVKPGDNIIQSGAGTYTGETSRSIEKTDYENKKEQLEEMRKNEEIPTQKVKKIKTLHTEE